MLIIYLFNIDKKECVVWAATSPGPEPGHGHTGGKEAFKPCLHQGVQSKGPKAVLYMDSGGQGYPGLCFQVHRAPRRVEPLLAPP